MSQLNYFVQFYPLKYCIIPSYRQSLSPNLEQAYNLQVVLLYYPHVPKRSVLYEFALLIL